MYHMSVATAPCTTLHCRSALYFSMGGLHKNLQLPLQEEPVAKAPYHLNPGTPSNKALLRTFTIKTYKDFFGALGKSVISGVLHLLFLLLMQHWCKMVGSSPNYWPQLMLTERSQEGQPTLSLTTFAMIWDQCLGWGLQQSQHCQLLHQSSCC